MRILVTGCNGQLGKEMQSLAAAHPQHTYFFTDVAELDITNSVAVDAFVQSNEVDCIVNCAAYTAVDRAESDEALCRVLNAVAPGYLAEAVAKRGGCMVHVSTDYVFDGTACVPYTEDMPTCPRSVYGVTKLEGERAVTENCPQSAVVRTAWLYSTTGNNFVKTMLRLGRERDTLGVVFDQIGTPTYARDLAATIYAMLDHGVVPGIYHYSNEGVTSWYDFTKAIHRIGGITTCEVRPLHSADYPAAAHRPHYSVLDKSKVKQTYDIEVPYWEDSLADCISRLQAASEPSV